MKRHPGVPLHHCCSQEPDRPLAVVAALPSRGLLKDCLYATAEPSYGRISGLTFATVTDEHQAESRASWDRRDVIGSVAVLVMILMAYLYFRG